MVKCLFIRRSPASSWPRGRALLGKRLLHTTTTGRRSVMELDLTAPNGKKWSQPLGLFINNEFVKSSNGQKLATINPA